jgi:hypothetical protein
VGSASVRLDVIIAFDFSGKFTVKVEVRDKDGGIGTSKTPSIRVG